MQTGEKPPRLQLSDNGGCCCLADLQSDEERRKKLDFLRRETLH